MTTRSLLSKWLVEYTSPVVIVITTPQVENISLQNGLLFHELLSAFGHLDGVNAQVRSINHHIPVVDAHIRFERISEVAVKNSGGVEECLRQSFEAYDINRLSNNIEELKSQPPTGWTSTIEQIIMRSMSFSEYEMISHPILILYAIASTDLDAIATMQELSSIRHMPECFATGQYDPQIEKAYLILHDNSAVPTRPVDPDLLYRQMKTKFPPSHTRLVKINSLPASSPNLQHPDLWTRWTIPMFFPQLAPTAESLNIKPDINPVSNTAVLGSRLSMEDFMGLRSFCMEIFQQEVIPSYERRVANLSRIVNDTKKGVKNVLKNFWRKPRDATMLPTKGVAHYRYDRIESQILLIADTSFGMRDYDGALSMYRLVKDDFKADKAQLHTAHTCLMIAACQFMLEPGTRNRELPGLVAEISQCLAANNELVHASAYFALMVTEILIAKSNTFPSPLEATQILLQAAALTSRYTLLTALLTEKASVCFLKAFQDRKYLLYTVISGYRYANCNMMSTTNHSAISFAVSLIIHDAQRWGTLRIKLLKSLANKFRFNKSNNATDDSKQGIKIALLLLLRILNEVSSNKDFDCFLGNDALMDGVYAYHVLLNELQWDCDLYIPRKWESGTSTAKMLNDPNPLLIENSKSNDDLKENLRDDVESSVVVENLRIPVLDVQSVMLLIPYNGMSCMVPYGETGNENLIIYKTNLLKKYLAIENSLENLVDTNVISSEELMTMCVERFLVTQKDLLKERMDVTLNSPSKSCDIRYCLGEKVMIQMKIHNPLPVELKLNNLLVEMNQNQHFVNQSIDVSIAAGATTNMQLYSIPNEVGKFKVSNAIWNLNSKFKVVTNIDKKGKLLQKTILQRASRERSIDNSLEFEITLPKPLLEISVGKNIQGFDILQGQIIETYILLKNGGGEVAKNIDLIFNAPYCIVDSNIVVYESNSKSKDGNNNDISDELNGRGDSLPFFGQSCTAVHLPKEITISPGQVAKIPLWIRINDIGKQEICILATYGNPTTQGSSSSDTNMRTSITIFEMNVCPSLDVSMSIIPRRTAATSKFMALHITNNLPPLNWSSKPTPPQTSMSRENLNVIPLTSDTSQSVTSISLLDSMIEGSCFVEDVVLLGGAKTEDGVVGIQNNNGRHTKYMANASECITIGIPMNYDQNSKVANVSQEGLKIVNASSSLSAAKWQQILDSFTYISQKTYEFKMEVVECNKRLLEKEMAGVDAQPRSIAQVRRDRILHSDVAVAVKTSCSADLDMDKNDITNYSVIEELKKHHLRELICQSEAKQNQTTIVIGWVCKWRGRMCSGLHLLHSQSLVVSSDFIDSSVPPSLPIVNPMLQSVNSLSSASALSSQNVFNVNDMIHIAMTHQQVINWDFSKGHCPVQLLLEFHSNFTDIAVVISVDALDWIDFNSSLVNKRRPPVRGLRWEGKSRFVDVVLPPLQTVKLPFLALILQRGVYNINRFRITVNKQNDEFTTPIIKVLNGSSFVSVQHIE